MVQYRSSGCSAASSSSAAAAVMTAAQAAPQHLESQLAAAEVYGRKGRALLEAAAVKRARDIAGPDHPDVHRAIVRFAQRGEPGGLGGQGGAW